MGRPFLQTLFFSSQKNSRHNFFPVFFPARLCESTAKPKAREQKHRGKGTFPDGPASRLKKFKDQTARVNQQVAAKRGQIDYLNERISQGDPVDVRDVHGETPLLYAAIKGRYEAATILLENGADVNLAENDGWTPLHFAACGRVDVVELLIKNKAKLNARNSFGWCAKNYHCPNLSLGPRFTSLRATARCRSSKRCSRPGLGKWVFEMKISPDDFLFFA